LFFLPNVQSERSRLARQVDGVLGPRECFDRCTGICRSFIEFGTRESETYCTTVYGLKCDTTHGSGGALNPTQPALIQAAIERMGEGAEIIIATDNDPDGRKLADAIGALAR
jgi:hypothetical protein